MPALTFDYLTRAAATLALAGLVGLAAKGLWQRSPHLGRGLVDDLYAAGLVLLALAVLVAGVSTC